MGSPALAFNHPLSDNGRVRERWSARPDPDRNAMRRAVADTSIHHVKLNLKRIKNLMPNWCIPANVFHAGMEQNIMKMLPHGFNPEKSCNININYDVTKNSGEFFWDEANHPLAAGKITFLVDTPYGNRAQVSIPYNDFFFPYRDGETHTLYLHQFSNGMSYVGITSQPWFKRLAQHISEAKHGSPYPFHRTIRNNIENFCTHYVVLHGISKNLALKMEEDMVEKLSLYPRGLNAIPGGLAGWRYLGSILGKMPYSVEERDAMVARVLLMDNINGRPNPLCAARWASDQEYINSVICGREDRFSLDQVRLARLYQSFGKTDKEISDFLYAPIHRVSYLLSGKTYSRVQ